MVEDEKEEEIYKKFGFSSIECLMLKSAINTMLAIRIQIVGFMKVVERLKTYEERIGEEGAEQQDEHGELFSAHMDTQQTQHENYDDSKGRGRGGCSNWRGRGPRRSGYYYVTTLHGGKSQEQSEINLEGFRAKKYNILVTTDTVGRGIDVLDVAHVINYDILKHMERYTHRIGRTRRAEKNFDAKLHSIGELDKTNRKAALSIFYSLALAEALMFLAEKAYWEWQVSVCSLLENVTKQCGFGVIGMVSIKRFFFDAFSKSVNGSNYDGDNVDMVSFVMELLGSSCPYEQLIGARILRKCAEDKIEKIGINLPVIERLVEMRNWKDVKEEEIRRSAAEILSKLAGMTQYSLRVAGITGAMESISSLLQNTRSLGLLILKKLSRDHDNYGKIGNIRGLLQKIIDFMHTDAILLKDENVEMVLSRFLTVKRSLQLVKMLVSMSKNTGRCLRREISEIVFTVSNLRDVLHHGVRYPKLQKLKIEILSFLALEREARERIGVTGGVMKELFNIFLKSKARRDVNERKVKIAAGEAIAMLDLESRSNCVHILKLGVLARLVDAFEVPLVRVNAARVLRNLCLYSEHECFIELRLIKAAAPMVLKSITSGDNKLQEVMLGLATQVFKFMSSEEVHDPLMDSGIKKKELAYLFVSTLKKHDKPSVKVPKIRFVVELARWMMEGDVENVVMFRDLAIKREQELLGAKDKIDTKESELIQMILAKREDEIKNKREDLAGEKEENLQDAERKALSEKKKLNRSKAGNIAANAVASNETQKSDTVTTPTVPDVFNSLQIKLWEYQVKKKAGQV
ncbi:BnaAnng36500D, partial [Brassica napus]